MRDILKTSRNVYLRTVSPFYFISFPKSGRTWVKSFLANYYAEYLDIPLFYNFAPVWKGTNQRGVPRIIYEHGVHCAEPDGERQKFFSRVRQKHIILLSRDPRTVVFSYYFRLTKRMKNSQVKVMPISQFIRDNTYGISSIVRFLNDWASSAKSFNGFLLLKYEDFAECPVDGLTTLLEFLGTPVDKQAIQIALSRSVDTTRKIEESTAGRADELKADILKGSQYFETVDAVASNLKRYAGDRDLYEKTLTEADFHYMDKEVAKLDPVFNYHKSFG